MKLGILGSPFAKTWTLCVIVLGVMLVCVLDFSLVFFIGLGVINLSLPFIESNDLYVDTAYILLYGNGRIEISALLFRTSA